MGVECFPDYIVYRDKHLTDSVIIFSSRCIKIKSLTHYIEDESFEFQWGVEDVINIESRCCERVSFNWPYFCSCHLKFCFAYCPNLLISFMFDVQYEMAMVKIHVISKGSVLAGDLHGTSGLTLEVQLMHSTLLLHSFCVAYI